MRLDEVNFKTMESRRCAGLYFAGEILDIDGLTGGNSTEEGILVVNCEYFNALLVSGYSGDGAKTVEQMGTPLGYLVPIGEFFGGVGLIFGFLSRFSAAWLIVIMLGAIATVHGQNGFFMQKGGFEYNLALIGLLLPILICGTGKFAVGR